MKYELVGCRNCGKGGDFSWRFYTDGKGNFHAEHQCGHGSDFKLTDKPDELRIFRLRDFQ